MNARGLETTGRISGSIQFFLYDTIKIMVLLGVLILMISYIQSYFPLERTKRILGGFHGIWANIIAALLGVVFSFMMGVTTLSLPSMIMLRKAVKPKLLGIFIAVCIVGIIVVGYFFNAVQYLII